MKLISFMKVYFIKLIYSNNYVKKWVDQLGHDFQRPPTSSTWWTFRNRLWITRTSLFACHFLNQKSSCLSSKSNKTPGVTYLLMLWTVCRTRDLREAVRRMKHGVEGVSPSGRKFLVWKHSPVCRWTLPYRHVWLLIGSSLPAPDEIRKINTRTRI